MVVAVGEGLVGPVGVVSGLVVVAAEGCEVVGGGGSAVGPGLAVVEVAFGGGDATAGEDAVGVASFDLAALEVGGPSSGYTVVDGHTAVTIGQGPAPFGSGLVFCDLAGDVGDDRPISG